MLYRILEVNLEDNSYRVLLGQDPVDKNIRIATKKFAERCVHPSDRGKFSNFLLGKFNNDIEDLNVVFYRRLVNGEYKLAVMEFINWGDPIVLITVRDAEKYVYDFLNQLKR